MKTEWDPKKAATNFRKHGIDFADAGGGNYQTLINEALRRQIEEESRPLVDTLRRVIREELNHAS